MRRLQGKLASKIKKIVRFFPQKKEKKRKKTESARLTAHRIRVKTFQMEMDLPPVSCWIDCKVIPKIVLYKVLFSTRKHSAQVALVSAVFTHSRISLKFALTVGLLSSTLTPWILAIDLSASSGLPLAISHLNSDQHSFQSFIYHNQRFNSDNSN